MRPHANTLGMAWLLNIKHKKQLMITLSAFQMDGKIRIAEDQMLYVWPILEALFAENLDLTKVKINFLHLCNTEISLFFFNKKAATHTCGHTLWGLF